MVRIRGVLSGVYAGVILFIPWKSQHVQTRTVSCLFHIPWKTRRTLSAVAPCGPLMGAERWKPHERHTPVRPGAVASTLEQPLEGTKTGQPC